MDTTSINWWPYPPWGATATTVPNGQSTPEPSPTPLSFSSAAEHILLSTGSSDATSAANSQETESLIQITALPPSSTSPLSIKPSGGTVAPSQGASTQFKILLPILIILSVVLGALTAWFSYGICVARFRRRRNQRERKEREDGLLSGTRRYEDITIKEKPFLIARDSSTNRRSPDLEAASGNNQAEFGWPEMDITTPLYTRSRNSYGEGTPHDYEEVSLVSTPKATRKPAQTKESIGRTKTAKTYQSRDTASLLSEDEDDENEKYGTLSAKLLSRIPASTRVVSATGKDGVDKNSARRRTSARNQDGALVEDDRVSTKTAEPRFNIIEDAPVHLEGTSASMDNFKRPAADRASSYYPSEYSYVPDEDIGDDQTAALIPSTSRSHKAKRHPSKKSHRSGRHVISRATTHYPDFNSDDEDGAVPPPALLPSSPSQIMSPLLASSLTFSASQVSLLSLQPEILTRMAVLAEAPEEEKSTGVEEKRQPPRKLRSPTAPSLPFPKGPGSDKVYRGRLVKKST